MADQTPAEMREHARELRDMAETWDEGLEAGELAAMRAGADALDARADVIELHRPRDEEAITGDCVEESCAHETCPTQTFPVCAECWRVAEESDPYFGERGIAPVLWPCETARLARGETTGHETGENDESDPT